MSSRDAGLGKDGVLAALPSPRVISRSIRIFSSSRGKRRFRRASDVVVLVPALLALAGLVIAFPPSRLERSFAAFLDSFPGWLDPLWGFTYDFAALWAVGLLLTAIVARRHIVTLQALASIAVAGLIAVVSARLAVGRWPDLDAVVAPRRRARPLPVGEGRFERGDDPRRRAASRPAAAARRPVGARARRRRRDAGRAAGAQRQPRRAADRARRGDRGPARLRNVGRPSGVVGGDRVAGASSASR